MSSLGSILSIARGAIQAQQVAIQTAGQNIANANVEGYSKQSVNVVAHSPQLFPYGSLGTGVVVQGVTRARDTLLDAQYRTAASDASGQGTTRDVLGRVESVMAEPGTSGLSSTIDAFFNSWSDLASDPTSLSARSVVKQRGVELANMFNGYASQLDDIAASNRAGLTSDVGKINDLTGQVAQLNVGIVAAESNHTSANDLRDQRDRVLDQLSSLAKTQVVERHDGSVGVYVNGSMIVDAARAHTLTVVGGTSLSIHFQGDPNSIDGFGGSVGAMLDAVNTKIPSALNGLDELAGSVVREVNAIHSSGTAFSGAPPVAKAAGNFFTQNGAAGTNDPAQTARGISVDAALADPTNIVASKFGATGPGNGDVAAALAALRDASVGVADATGAVIANTSLGAFYRDTVAGIGVASSQASSQASVSETLASQASTRRESVSGVATDEELMALIKYQQAYAAAARLITVVDQMSQTLLAIGT